MDKYYCPACEYGYDPAYGDSKANIPPGVRFEDLPYDWCCPECGASKRHFRKLIEG